MRESNEGRYLGGNAAIGLAALRVFAGTAMMAHGWSKIQNPFAWMGSDSSVPGFMQALAALAEFGGGLALGLGLLTSLAALGIMAVMTGALLLRHIPNGDPFVGRGGSLEPAMGYFAIGLMFLLVGPGTISLDAVLFGRRSGSGPDKP